MSESSADDPDDAVHDAEHGDPPPCRIVTVLGTGAGGITYLGETDDRGSFPRYVVLRYLPVVPTPADPARRIGAALQRIAMFVDPACAEVYAAGVTSGGRPYLMSEYVRGLPLLSFAEQHALQRDARLLLATDLARAVDAFGRAGLAHGALTTGNVRVVGAGQTIRARILDLGVRQLLALADPALPAPTADDDARDVERLRQALLAGV